MKRFIRKKVFVVITLIVLILSTSVYSAGVSSASTINSTEEPLQPYSSYWFPKQLLEWSPETDRDATFNISSIPLAKRFTGEKVNGNAAEEPKVVALSIMNPSTSANPSQGSEKFGRYTFSYWQYIDMLVMWGGSSGEGIILSPSADVIDPAHKNGVPVLGTVFFPPTAYGGKTIWLDEFLVQREDGSFPVADKLIEVAKYYGFDGWFINQETPTNTTNANKMQQFLKYFQAKKSPGMHIQWYDAMRNSGSVGWQGGLTTNNQMFFQDGENRVSDSMFIDFRWRSYSNRLPDSRTLAGNLGRDPYDLYAGIDVQANGYNTGVSWNTLFPQGQKAPVSLGIYCPDWTFHSSKTHEEYYNKENRFWVGANGDPRNTLTTSSWKGIANYIIEKSSITEMPFITNFNTGNGNFFAIDGEVLKRKEWNNRSLQDILPTWRWIVDSQGVGLKPSFDWATAYYGGSSLKVSGNLGPDNATHIKLYKTNLKIDKGTELSIMYQTPLKQSNMKVAIAFAEDPDNYVYLDAGDANPKKWNKKAFSLDNYRGKTISTISLFFESKTAVKNYSINIGQIALTNDDTNNRRLPSVSNLKIEGIKFRDGIYGEARVSWDKLNQDVHLYEIYRINPDGKRDFIGATPNNVYYIPQMRRIETENQTTLQVVPINKRYKAGKSSETSFDWPEYPKPMAKFTVSKTFIKPGDEVKFFNASSEVTEELVWQFPGGVPSTSNAEQPTVVYENEGTYSVTLTAKNKMGDDIYTEEALITVSNDAVGVKNIALGKPTAASSFVNNTEAPKSAVDGVPSTKWCAVGDGPHWLTVDLGAESTISEFIVKHAEAGGESASMNTSSFKILVSNDNVNWTDAADVKGNTLGISNHPVRITRARYAKLFVIKPTQGGDTAARIYEFEVHGLTD